MRLLVEVAFRCKKGKEGQKPKQKKEHPKLYVVQRRVRNMNKVARAFMLLLLSKTGRSTFLSLVVQG